MEPERLGRLIDTHAAALTLYARQWCVSPEDVVQVAFSRLAGCAPSDPVAWLYRVVRNAAISAGRSERRRKSHEGSVAGRGWFTPNIEDRIDGEAAAQALDGLPPPEREAVVAHVWGGLSFAEIGDLMGTSAPTAFRRYAAALEKLRDRLERPCPTPTYPPS